MIHSLTVFPDNLLLLTLALVCSFVLCKPWFGVIIYYLLALLHPEGIWPPLFESFRFSLFVGVSTIVGLLILGYRGRLRLGNYLHPQPALVLVLCGLVNPGVA